MICVQRSNLFFFKYLSKRQNPKQFPPAAAQETYPSEEIFTSRNKITFRAKKIQSLRGPLYCITIQVRCNQLPRPETPPNVPHPDLTSRRLVILFQKALHPQQDHISLSSVIRANSVQMFVILAISLEDLSPKR